MATCNNDNRTEASWMDIGLSVYAPNGSKSYTEPKQGCVNDCFFLAALVSVAWAANAKLKTHPNYQFFNGAAWDPAFSINKNLAVDSTLNLVYARTTSQYIWPCLYEKAYAVWKDTQHRQQPPISSVLSGGSGLTALRNIYGGSLTVKPAETAIPVIVNQNNRTQYPTIAQTNATPGAGLIANHTYSVLKKSGPGWELRDPCSTLPVYVDHINTTKFNDWGYVR